MRFSITNLLLAGTALAAPVQDANQVIESSKHESLLSRGLVPLLERAPMVPFKPAAPHVEPPPPVAHPVSPGGPAHLPPGGPEVQPLRPQEPGSPGSKPGDDLPGVRPEKPNGPKEPEGRPSNRCLKRGGAGCHEGTDIPKDTDGIDGKYERTNKPMSELDVEAWGNQDYLKAFGLFDAKADDLPQWRTSSIKNDAKTREDFEKNVWPGMQQDLKGKQWSQQELDELHRQITEPRRENLVEANYSPSQGGIVVKQAWNKEFDLNREFTGKVGDKEYTRPAVNSANEVRFTKMIMDDYTIAAKAEGLEANTLRHISSEAIATPESKALLESIIGNKANQKVPIDPSHPKYAEVQKMVQAKPFNHMLVDDNPELGLKVTGYSAYKDKPDMGSPMYYFMVDIAPN